MASILGQVILVLSGFCCFTNIVLGNFIDVGVKYSVTLDVFSGVDDPEWEVDDTNPIYARVAWAVNSVPTSDLDDDLGYRGFIVKATNIFGQEAYKTVGRHSNEDLENSLLKSCPLGLDKDVMKEVTDGIMGAPEPESGSNGNLVVYQPVNILMKNNGQKIRHSFYIPVHHRSKRQAMIRPVNQQVCSVRFEPEKWNVQGVRRRNNCYNYATNRQTNTFAQPGRGSGRKFTQLEANDVYSACLRDGLTKLNAPDAGNECLIALVIWPGEDFHFYRLDDNGFWSHKSGQTLARDYDDSNNKISNPQTADRGPYTVFAGWLGCGPHVTLN
ncbi:hypothetical protein ACF0H5_020151 [Mactra antiquata]